MHVYSLRISIVLGKTFIFDVLHASFPFCLSWVCTIVRYLLKLFLYWFGVDPWLFFTSYVRRLLSMDLSKCPHLSTSSDSWLWFSYWIVILLRLCLLDLFWRWQWYWAFEFHRFLLHAVRRSTCWCYFFKDFLWITTSLTCSLVIIVGKLASSTTPLLFFF